MSTNKHPHIDAIVAYFNGEEIEHRAMPSDEWHPVTPLNARSGGSPCPSFSPDWQYRIKPKTHTIELTEGELELLFLFVSRVGGCPKKTARKHASSLYYKVRDLIAPDRRDQLRDWALRQQIHASCIREELPK